MNLAHFAFLVGLCIVSFLLVLVMIIFHEHTPVKARIIQVLGITIVLSLIAIWIGLLCKLVASIIYT
jgi:hypothetical protein